MQELDENTLEEGRMALYQLERQLKSINIGNMSSNSNEVNDSNSIGSKQQSLQSERKLMDQIPRDARLHYRLGSPLGLTVEELDDRGLLDGGASVPSYYTSIKQRNRRQLEMQKRSTRLEHRGKDGILRHIEGFYHMLRTLARRGVNIESKFFSREQENRVGIYPKEFLRACQELNLPFTHWELHDFCSRYILPGSELIDMEGILRDSEISQFDVQSQPESLESMTNVDEKMDISLVFTVAKLKDGLLASMKSVGKNVDDVYRMFAKWDTEGSGSITATQFLRTLGNLHVDLSDQEQDFLVELLDTDGVGRVHFDGLLTFCFLDIYPELNSSKNMSLRALCMDSQDNCSKSGLSYDNLSYNNRDRDVCNNNNISSPIGLTNAYSNNNPQASSNRRPLTASGARPQLQPVSPQLLSDGAASMSGPSSGGSGASYARSLRQSAASSSLATGGGVSTSMSYSKPRPVTANGRVSSGSFERLPMSSGSNANGSQVVTLTEGEIVEVADDVLDEGVLHATGPSLPLPSLPPPILTNINRKADRESLEVIDGSSINEYTQVTLDQDEYPLPSPSSRELNLQYGHSNNPRLSNESSSDYTMAHMKLNSALAGRNHNDTSLIEINNGIPNGQNRRSSRIEEEDSNTHLSDPIGHLSLLATQTLVTVREFLLSKYRMGRSLNDIYSQFDRNHKRYFDAADFVRATAEFRMEISMKVAEIAIREIAVDSFDRVCFGEFRIYVLDPDARSLEANVQEQMAMKFELQGWPFLDNLRNMFFSEEGLRYGQAAQRYAEQVGLVTCKTFVYVLDRLYLKLSPNDVERLEARFDINGQGFCSVERFLRMVTRGESWKRAETVLNCQEEASKECEFLREVMAKGYGLEKLIPADRLQFLTVEVLNMAEYLGIKPISESHMLWIAVDAIQAPLPVNWIAQRDTEGRIFFYNKITHQSKWDHPLDPHFRKLRDRYRQW